MFDPDTLVCRVFGKSIWHHDPCLDGSDDSCGWSYIKLNEKEKARLKSDMEFEKHCITEIYKKWHDSYRMEVIYCIYRSIKWSLMRKRLTAKDYQYIMDLALNTHDGLKIYYEEPFERIYWNIGRLIKTKYRKWWQHPKFHFWHWRIS